MNANFEKCFQLVLQSEGGFVDNPNDPGGATNHGVTLDSWSDFIGQTVSIGQIKALTPDDVRPFYKTRYWDVLGCDQLPGGLDYCVFDFGVNSGIHRAAISLQVVLGTHLDGIIGPQTIETANQQDEKTIIGKYQTLRLQFLSGLQGSAYFGNGWGARVAKVTATAMEMA